jgi:hypothetical protein
MGSEDYINMKSVLSHEKRKKVNPKAMKRMKTDKSREKKEKRKVI